MNITDVFFNNGQWNLSAISIMSNSILVTALVLITGWYAREVAKQTEFMKKDRLIKEMDKLVKKLYSKIKDDNIFRKENPYNGIGSPEVQHRYEIDEKERYRFWDEIKQNKYLGPDYLRSTIDNYLENRGYGGGHEGYKAYKTAETGLYRATEKRYLELQYELEEKTWIIKKWYSKVKTKLSRVREKS